MWAAQDGYLEIVKCLVNAGANLYAKDKVQFTKSLVRAINS